MVNGTGSFAGGDEIANSIVWKNISVRDNVDLTFNNVAGNHPNISGNGNISINFDKQANTAGVYIDGNISANNLTIKTIGTTKGISTEYGVYSITDKININLNNNLTINSGYDSIFATESVDKDIIISAQGKVDLTSVSGRGIFNADLGTNNIIVSAKKGISINSGTNANTNWLGGVLNFGNGKVELSSDAGTIYINSGDAHGVKTQNTSITNLYSLGNFIIGEKNGVTQNGGELNIKATNSITNSVALFSDYYNKYNNVFIGETGSGFESSGSGTSKIIAGNNNVFGGLENGILSTSSGTIYADAKNNIVGFDENDNIYNNEGELITDDFIGKNGIYVESGKVTLDADNENRIKATENAVYSLGADSEISLNGAQNIITVQNVDGVDEGQFAYGLRANDNSSITIKNLEKEADYTKIYVESTENSGNGSIAVESELNGKIDLTSKDIDITAKSAKVGHNFEAIGVKNENNLIKNNFNIVSSENLSIYSENIKGNTGGQPGLAYGVYVQDALESNFVAKDLIITAKSNQGGGESYGIWAEASNGQNDDEFVATDVTTSFNANNFSINAEATNGTSYGVYIQNNKTTSKNTVNITTTTDINIAAKVFIDDSKSDNGSYAYATAIRASGADVSLSSENGEISLIATSEDASIELPDNKISVTAIGINSSALSDNMSASHVELISKKNSIYSDQQGVLSDGSKSTIEVNATGDGNFIYTSLENSSSQGVISRDGGHVVVNAEKGSNHIEASNAGVLARKFVREGGSSVVLNAKYNEVLAEKYGLYADTDSSVTLNAENNNELLNAGNFITANDLSKDKVQQGYGNGCAISSKSGSTIKALTSGQNKLLGAVVSSGNNSTVNILGLNDSPSNINEVWSYGVIAGAGDLDEDATEGESSFKDKNVISALYAEEGAKITLSGKTNRLYTTADPNEHDDLERVVWAYNGASEATTISIDGHTDISTNQYDKSLNSIDIAIAAGTAVNLKGDIVSQSKDLAVEDRAQVLVNYADLTDDKGSVVQQSSITGDILAAYAGYVDIKPAENTNAGINITGNILAGNNGIVKIDLGKGGSLTGRADDYGDASVGDGEDGNKGHQNSTYFNPAFSSSIYEGGAVNLKMGEGSQWNVTGQSWITSINTGITGSSAADVSALPTIDLTQANNAQNSAAAGLTVYNFNGDSNFKMKLDGNNLTNSNMLYMKQANGNYYIELEDAVSADEINTALHDGLRFATVGKDSNVHFSVGSRDDGVFNVEYEVGQDNYDETVAENVHYNGSELTAEKPSDSTVKDFFGNEGTPVEEVSGDAGIATASAVMALAEDAEVKAAETQEDSATGAVNHKIIGISSTEISDGGKTVINMSRANYANAVYMDTLNKRQGEARFVGSTDHGVWVRLRHDNIGKEDAFRSHNTMVEVGIDQRDVHDYGEFHTGVALDYMNGSLDYHTVDGDGDIERYGIWFYTTYLGNDGQYADLILKYGHLKNDFGFNTKTQGEHVTGDYTNETASISAEYGWKFSNSHNYYIEPQAQLQYTYITGADYTTSQGSRVDLDSIHSLIGRVGFRAGKDFLDWEHPATFYLRADALHEFLGDQDIRAYDNTGVMDITYENDDTWYTVGLGMTVKSSDNTYFFIEGETALGADNEDTYTVSGGFRHSF